MVTNNKIYCVKCKDHTANAGKASIKQAKNGRYMVQVPCKTCGTTKNRIVSDDNVPAKIKNNPKVQQGGFIFSALDGVLGSLLGGK